MNNIIHCAVPEHICRVRIQIWRIMRLSFIFIFAALMQVSASTKAQRITLTERNTPLKEVLKKIKLQSGMDIFYADYLIKQAKKVTVNINDLPLTEALDKVLEDQRLSYEVKDKTIVLKREEPSFLNNLVARFSVIDIRGKVIGENDEVLAGATVKVKGGNNSAITNAEGEFYLKNVEEGATIVVSFIGYVTRELKAKKDLGEIKLAQSANALDEVVLKGYYSESKRLSTGSVVKVKAEDIAKSPVSNPLAAMQGRISGMQITQATGVPGSGFTVRIRGQNSLRNTSSDNGNDPLYIIDGVPFSSVSLINQQTSFNIHFVDIPMKMTPLRQTKLSPQS